MSAKHRVPNFRREFPDHEGLDSFRPVEKREEEPKGSDDEPGRRPKTLGEFWAHVQREVAGLKSSAENQD